MPTCIYLAPTGKRLWCTLLLPFPTARGFLAARCVAAEAAAPRQPTCTVCKATICKAAQGQTEEAILRRYSNVLLQISSRTNIMPKTKQSNILNQGLLMRKHGAASCSTCCKTFHSHHFRTGLTTNKKKGTSSNWKYIHKGWQMCR